VVEEDCYLTSHVVVSGFSRIEKYGFVGVNATVGYLQFCPTIQSTWETLRGLKDGKRAPPFAE
jgi:hypothetical protein